MLSSPLMWASERVLTGVARHSRGVRSVLRPATDVSPEFALTYVRSGEGSKLPPVVVIPGGPGLGSVLPYRSLRARAARGGLDLIMIEHRGVGLSRHDLQGRDLPPSSMRISEVLDDIAMVLDHERVRRAFIVGSSYGSYLASSFGVAYPDRVAGMLLDSSLQSSNHIDLERKTIRDVLWNRAGPLTETVRQLASTGIEQRILLDVMRAAYELGGDELLLPLLRSRLRNAHQPVWKALEMYATRDASIARIPAIYDFDLVGTIGFRELGYGAAPDGLPLDPALTYSQLTSRFPPFVGEPYDLIAGAQSFEWPLVLLSGTRDLRTPPEIASQVAATAPEAVFVSLENGHSALDTHPLALLNALRSLAEGSYRQLPEIAHKLDRLPRRGLVARLPQILKAGVNGVNANRK